ncbi:fibronectin type III domain-containing protein [Flavivirga jejuensis]|uniref:Fibronectin type III domain-containing protein n=1 Tax=Flavivirga jejuensis TaxID=870487 RepID=A0ABT8WMZ2_9FLAO|nr:fibronectin type III domain-containing protein [Flavivirga jejuensis]MDO5974520.1 fibronectin type III domain-containing protein [Flavivirga jejuensis]
MKKLIYLCCLLLTVLACDDIIGVVNISNETVTAIAPATDAVLTDNDVIFIWEAIEGAENYKIQIATPNFANAAQIVTDSTLTKTLFSKTLNSGNYEWRVRAENSAYTTNYVSHQFIIDSDVVDISNEIVNILTPTNDATFLTTDTIEFSWEAIQGANQYIIQIATPDFENPTETVKDETRTSTSFSVSNLAENSYECRVKAKNIAFETVYTEIGFTVNE